MHARINNYYDYINIITNSENKNFELNLTLDVFKNELEQTLIGDIELTTNIDNLTDSDKTKLIKALIINDKETLNLIFSQIMKNTKLKAGEGLNNPDLFGMVFQHSKKSTDKNWLNPTVLALIKRILKLNQHN